MVSFCFFLSLQRSKVGRVKTNCSNYITMLPMHIYTLRTYISQLPWVPILRVIPLFVSLILGIRIRLKGIGMVIFFLVTCWSVLCSVYITLPTLTAFFGGTNLFYGSNNLFNSFLTVLRIVLSPLFLFFYFYVIIPFLPFPH